MNDQAKPPALRFEGHLVGMRFRPPADVIVGNLAAGTDLVLMRQPDNPHDENAIAVLLAGFQGEDFTELRDEAEAAATAQGLVVEEWLTDPIYLGFISRNEAALISKELDAAERDGRNVEAKLSFNLEGRPKVIVLIEPREGDPTDGENPDAPRQT
jgi:hypothetical protein